jgi:hypothetical protein
VRWALRTKKPSENRGMLALVGQGKCPVYIREMPDDAGLGLCVARVAYAALATSHVRPRERAFTRHSAK